jgi:hypothetical protein
MGKRRKDADTRRFFDEFQHVRVSRFRATGVIDPAKNYALIPFPNGQTKLIGTQHIHFPNGGGWSFFVCPKCDKRAAQLWLVEDAPRCWRCCEAMNIRRVSQYGFGRAARRANQDKRLDELIAKLETKTPLKFKPAHPSWGGRAQQVYNSRALTQVMRRRLVQLRLSQLASQQARERAHKDDELDTMQPRAEARELIDLTAIWRANSSETLAQALDKAQVTILAALNSDDPQRRLNAAKLLLRTKQARERGLS